MRRKQFWMGIAVAIISISASFTASVGGWEQDDTGWWHNFGDTTYAKGGWQWVDGKCYYFTPEGYCLLNTATPDGYTVDASEARTVDGVVQVQTGGTDNQGATGEVYQLGNMIFTKSADYRLETVQDTTWRLSKEDDSQISMISSSESGISDGILSEEESGKRSDNFMLRNSSTWDSKEIVELMSEKWFAHVHSAETTRNGYHDKRYLRLKNNRVEMIILDSRDANMDKDGFLNQYARQKGIPIAGSLKEEAEMLKRLLTGTAAAIISISASFTAFAGEWKQDSAGWWYGPGDTGYAENGWHRTDRKCYYSTSDGYCLLNTTTPNGYMVDASGAWTVDGVVQVQAGGMESQEVQGEVYWVGNMRLTLPEDLKLLELNSAVWSFVNSDKPKLLLVTSVLTDITGEQENDEEYVNVKIDANVLSVMGVWDSRKTVELALGKWRTYKHPNDDSYSSKLYARSKNHPFEMFIFDSLNASIDKDGSMNRVPR